MADRGGFDVAFDRIVTQLEAFSATEVAAGEDGYTVRPDAYRYQTLSPGAYVFLYQSNLTPQSRQTARAVHFEYDIEYIMDLLVEHKGASSGGAYSRADALAGERLRYLEQQVIVAMTDPAWYDMGFEKGVVGKRPLPRFEPLPPEIANQGERPLIGARAWMEISLAWDPTRLTGTDLEQLHVDAGRFAALYEYGG
ncbi:MAG: hypothetical protein ACOCZB_05940 [Spirochaetota bacterium]